MKYPTRVNMCSTRVLMLPICVLVCSHDSHYRVCTYVLTELCTHHGPFPGAGRAVPECSTPVTSSLS